MLAPPCSIYLVRWMMGAALPRFNRQRFRGSGQSGVEDETTVGLAFGLWGSYV